MTEQEKLERKLLKKAKLENLPQLLSTHTASCFDPLVRCDMDIVTTFINPDGTKATFRKHKIKTKKK